MELSLVIPAHNEAGHLAVVLAEARVAMSGHGHYEIIVVDDGSDDATPALLAALRQRYPELRALRHAHRSGQSAALCSGIRAAQSAWIVTLDGDGQNDPADIAKLLTARDAAPATLALIAGQRVRRRDARSKRWSSIIANAVRRRVLGDATPDTGCGLKLMRRDAFLALPVFDHMHRFLPALVRRAGFTTLSVPVSHRPRTTGATHYGVHNRLWVGLIDLFGVWWLQRRALAPKLDTEHTT